MSFLSSLIGAFIPLAHAQRLQTAGASNAGVRDMWTEICSVLPCSTPYASATDNGLVTALANSVIGFLFPLVSVVAVCMVIYAGIVIVMSNGSEDKIGEAKKIIMYAVVGVVLSLLTGAVVAFLTYYLGIIFS